MTPWVRTSLQDLARERADVLIIGGGITGAGIAHLAALCGLRVALVEARDFAAGTSSHSSRLIHGGLRYLEQGRIRLVRESLHERAVLLGLAPHLVRPIPFLLPFYRKSRLPGWKARIGLSLYDLLAGRGNVARHQTLGKRAVLQLEPRLRAEGLRGGAIYYDGQCDDARLTLAALRAAAGAGASLANYTEVISLLPDGARLAGVRLRDRFSGAEADARARLIINATGPWSDAVRRLEDPTAEPMLRLTKGVHILVPRTALGNAHAITFTSPLDGRVMFVLPWEDWAYVGTTDTDFAGPPDRLSVEDAEVAYLLRSVNALFPAARLEEDAVVSSWAGLRPLLAANPQSAASELSREHRIRRGPLGMLSILGGKLTTFRAMAREVLDHAAAELGLPRRRLGQADGPYPGGETSDATAVASAGAASGLSPATLAYLLRQYGSETEAVLRLCRRAELRNPLHPAHPAIAAQVVFAAEREYACTPDDILWRRTRLGLETRDHGASARPEIERLLSEARGADSLF